MSSKLSQILTLVESHPSIRRFGRITAVGPAALEVEGLGPSVRTGDLVEISGTGHGGEVVALDGPLVRVMSYMDTTGLHVGQAVKLNTFNGINPCDAWQGRILDAFCTPLDGTYLPQGDRPVPLRAPPPPATLRRPLGPRIATGVAALDTLLPLTRGQRIGVFAGSGVGKTSLLTQIARDSSVDRVVFGLIGERGREVRHFMAQGLGTDGQAKSIIIAATSDQSPLIKRRAAWTAMAIAEYFRDRGEHVLLVVDSLTRMAEAHREVALTAGEAASLRAFPPSTAGMISALVERAGPGVEGQGDITAVFSVLVAGSDMEEPVADIARGVLDGHVVLDREIAERGRFPAIDVRRSVSRALPDAATPAQNAVISAARRVLGTYEAAAPMIQSGLYAAGSDPDIDNAARIWPDLDRFFGQPGDEAIDATFSRLSQVLALPEQ